MSKYFCRWKGEHFWKPIYIGQSYFPQKNRKFRQERFPFWTGVCDASAFDSVPIFARNWHIDFRVFFRDNTLVSEAANSEIPYNSKPLSTSVHGHLEYQPDDLGISMPHAIIFAEDSKVANSVLLDICATFYLLTGNNLLDLDDAYVCNDPISQLPSVPLLIGPLEENHKINTSCATDGVFEAIRIVAKTWNDFKARIAISRLWISSRIVYVHKLDAYPGINRVEPTEYIQDFTALALAITSSYSALEELGLTPKSTRNQKAFDNGKWNETIVQKLINKLRELGIDPFQKITWLKRWRTGKHPVEKIVATPEGEPANWNYRTGTADKHINLFEAILSCARLRNKVAAHDTKSATTKLTGYDLINVNVTVQAVLLSYVKFDNKAQRNIPSELLEFAVRTGKKYTPVVSRHLRRSNRKHENKTL